jgi:hypothetical protein
VLGVDLAYRQARVVAHLDGEWLARAWLAPGRHSAVQDGVPQTSL